jgi:hypothetical protein
MIINVTFDASAAGAPQGFEADVSYVASLFEALFTNPVTINIDVGWGEVDGQSLSKNSLGESLQHPSVGYSFAQVEGAAQTIAAAGDPLPLLALPTSDPTHGAIIDPGSAEARALGLMAANSGSIDGWIGLSSQPGTFFFDQSQPVDGEFDAIGVIEHEFSEILGRGAGGGPQYFTVLDMYRYSGHTLDATGTANPDAFSIDRGATALQLFNTDPTGDPGDWGTPVNEDAFQAFADSGLAANLSTVDLIEMGALGWSDIPAILNSAFTNVLWTSPTSPIAANPTLTLANGTIVDNPIHTDAGQLAGLASGIADQQSTLQQGLTSVEQMAIATTTVSTLSYEFFTGKTPTAAGYQYLIDSSSNPNNLDSPYYALFNIQNRFINFAVNLGKDGAGMVPFNDTYGADTLAQAATSAYTEIFGFAPAAGKIDTILNSTVSFNGISETRAQYFAAYGGDGPNGIGAKAAMVGWLLEVAVQSDLGPYAHAADAFLNDLALGNAQFNIDVLTAYGFTHQTPLIGVSGG